MSRTFKGIRRRVEGERAQFAINAVREQGFTVTGHGRLGNETGYFIRTKEGPAINYYDTGTITVTGTHRHKFRDTEMLRMPDGINSVLIVAAHDNDDLFQLCVQLQTLGMVVDTAFYSQPTWMKKVALARRRGMHVMAFVSSDSNIEHHNRILPDAYFGIGLLVARLQQEHLTVLCDESVRLPEVYGLLGSNLITYGGGIRSVEDQLRVRFAGAGFVTPQDSIAAPAA